MHLLPLDETLRCSLDTNKTIDNGQHKLTEDVEELRSSSIFE